MIDQQSNPQFDPVANALRSHGWRRQRGRDARPKLRGQCLFHDDPAPSADFYLDDGWYYCFACAQLYTIEDVARHLGLAGPNEKSQPEAGSAPSQSSPGGQLDHYHSTLGQPTAVYIYKFPDGRISHYKCRFSNSQSKTFRIHAPDGQWQQPIPFWPIYGDYRLPKGLSIVLVEGEKAVRVINAATQTYEGVLIVALTMGSANNMESSDARKTLIARLKELAPLHVLVWPDNDKPGYEWSKQLHRQLSAEALPVKLVDVRALALDKSQGADDFIARGGSLEEVFTREFQQIGGYTLESLIKDTVVTQDSFMLHASRELLAFKQENLQVHYYRATGDSVAQPKIIQRLGASLRSKAFDTPAKVWWRRWHDQYRTELFWRPKSVGYAYRIDGQSIAVANDPPSALLLTPDSEPVFSPTVDESGTRDDLERLCEFFGQDQISTTMIEGWLLCALIGLETPILLMRGEAGSGKTIFSRLLAGIIEPSVPSIDLPPAHRSQIAERALRNGLQRSVVAVIDNVSSMAYESEDLLCRFVTGYSTMYSPLYEERVVNMTMRRGLILSTANWAPGRGDLASRSVVLRTSTPTSSVTTEKLEQKFGPTLEKIRGYLFKTAHFYYQNTARFEETNGIRLAGLSKVFTTLGYDTHKLARHLTMTRSQLASESDTWYDVMLDFYHQLFGQTDTQDAKFVPDAVEEAKWEEIKGFISGRTGYAPTDRELSRFLNDALPKFRDYGFTVERKSTGQNRLWKFKCLFEPQGDE